VRRRADVVPEERERLAAAIERQVRHAAHGGVADLEVQVVPEGIRLRGHCGTYYCKQLAQHAAVQSIATRDGLRLINEIEVR
jgi:hypothetical protein